MNGQNGKFEHHVCPHCGQRNRVDGRPVCAEGKKVFDDMVKAAAKALLENTEIPQVWPDIFSWAYYIGKNETFPRLERELIELQAAAARRKEEIHQNSVETVAKRVRGKEGSIPVAVREEAVAQMIKKAEFEDETLKRAHGRGLGLEDLRRHLQRLQVQMGETRQKVPA